MPASIRARRREVALILRRASEAGRFDRLVAPACRTPYRDWEAITALARELIDPDFEDVDVVANISHYYTHGVTGAPSERVAFRVNGMDEDDLLGPRNGS